ncbi:MAG: hypothetical protein KGL02_14110 [Acidobacteriota bacterium]|nr:hypothetical protein [Acidobacteriota bacterium]
MHNHPSRDPSASRDDIEMTKSVRRAAAALGITLIDHIIVAGTQWLSFERQGWL